MPKKELEARKLKVYQCPHCKYIVEKVCFENFRADFGCPRCYTTFMHFDFKEI